MVNISEISRSAVNFFTNNKTDIAAAPRQGSLDSLMASPSSLERFGSANGSSYVVQRGDSLSAIAQRHGTNWQTLARINGLTNPDLIMPGQKLQLPQGTATSYTVQRGDTLSNIAAANGTSVAALVRDNGIANANRIFPGQTLKITSGAGPAGSSAPAGNAAGSATSTNNSGSIRPDANSIAAARYAENHVLSSSSGYCYRYVKQALQATGAVNDYIPGVAAKDAGPALEARGFVNVLQQPGNNIRSAYDAPVGAVLVYGPAPGATDRNARYGHIELRTEKGFASDYLSARARTGDAASGLTGRGRTLIGVYVKPDPNVQAANPTGSPTNAGSLEPASTLNGRVDQAVAFFESKGWSREQAVGIAANLVGESNVTHDIRQIGGGPGYGLAQWEGPRQADFARWAGHDIRSSTFVEQLNFIQHELTTTESGAARRLEGATTAAEAARIVTYYYERPADKAGDAAERAIIANGIMDRY